MPNKVPKGWKEMSNIGAVVPDTHFIAFKTPLSWRMEWNLRSLKRAEPRLTHIIDLTNEIMGAITTPASARGWVSATPRSR